MNEHGNAWMAVVNVFAASKKAGSLWKNIELELKNQGVTYHSRMTGVSGSAAEITFDACVAGYRRFISVGGDGTVHDVLDGVAAFIDWATQSGRKASFADFTIAVIPVGSGNDWIKSVGVPKDMKKAVALVASGLMSRQDVVRVSVLDPVSLDESCPISVSYMMNVGGIGIDARVCERVNLKKSQGRRGKKLYVGALIHAIRHRSASRAKVYCDGGLVYDGAYFSIAFGVGRYSGGGMRQTPAAVIDDGLLDMTLIPELPMRRIAVEAPRLFTGTFLKVPELVAVKARNIMVVPCDNSHTEPVEVDGEVIGKAPVRFDVMDSQINVIADVRNAL